MDHINTHTEKGNFMGHMKTEKERGYRNSYGEINRNVIEGYIKNPGLIATGVQAKKKKCISCNTSRLDDWGKQKKTGNQ